MNVIDNENPSKSFSGGWINFSSNVLPKAMDYIKIWGVTYCLRPGIVLSDPGNNNGEFNNSQESKKPPAPKQVIEKRQEQPVTGGSDHTKETQRQQIKKHGTITKTVKALNEESGSRRPIMPNGLQKLNNEAKIPTKSDMSAEQRKPNPSTEKLKVSDKDAYKLKLEATKRKLHEKYHKAETVMVLRILMQALPPCCLAALPSPSPHSLPHHAQVYDD
ncbi:hypothetical protein Droror1_Dr00025536 [Drosera rotundifolia]